MTKLKLLIVEDFPSDVELIVRELERLYPDCETKTVERKNDYIASLLEYKPDLIISDYKLPSFDGLTALNIKLELSPQVPFIILTGSMNEDTAVACMKAGATDYVIKSHMKRLGNAIAAALEQQSILNEKLRAEKLLVESEASYRYMFECNPQPMWIYSKVKDRFLAVNDSALKLYNYQKAEFLHLSLAEIESGDTEANLPVEFSKLRESVKDKIIRKHYKKDRTTLYAEIIIHQIEFGGEKAEHTHIVDITARVQAELEIQKQLRELQLWYEVSLDRENRMIELKKEVNALLTTIGQKPRYTIVETE